MFIKCSIQSVGMFKAHYISLPGRPVHSEPTRLLREAFNQTAAKEIGTQDLSFENPTFYRGLTDLVTNGQFREK